MKKTVCALLVLLGCGMVWAEETPLISGTAFQPKQWGEQYFAQGVTPPFSFVYGGEKSDKFINDWQFQSQNLSSSPSKDVAVFTYTDPKTGLAVKCEVTFFKDFPAVEWVLKFVNMSEKNTPILEKVKVIDHTFATDGGDLILHHSRGSDASRSDFAPMNDKIPVGEHIYMTPSCGRSSDTSAFPFFNIETPNKQGIVVAVGWTGKWYADVARSKNTAFTLESGMERMALTLYPHEEIRTPRICFLYWKGDDRMTGHNQFRRFILAHHSRMIDGHFAEYPLAGSFDYGDPPPCGEYEALTEKYAIGLVERYQYFDILPEVFWLDAGWYAGCGFKPNGQWWSNVGNWTVAKERFPHGLRAVADAIHQTGAKFLVWFEPERVRPGTQFDKEHPEWLIKLSGNDNYLFDLGNKEACQWLIDYMTEFLKREGIDHYRQDFNFDPYPYWTAKDAATPDRVGMAEIRHIEGLYAYWDVLLERFPNMLIDNCASGGRRIDLETTSRSAPLWRTDYQYGEPKGYQCHTYALHFYLPQHGTGAFSTDNYIFRSSMGATMGTSWEVTGKSSEPIANMQQRIREYKLLRPNFYGDYYPLTPLENYTNDDVWLAYQFYRPEHRDGIVAAFRRDQNKNETIKVQLSGLDDNLTYEVYDQDKDVRIKKSGKELKAGLDLTIPQCPGSLLIWYKASE